MSFEYLKRLIGTFLNDLFKCNTAIAACVIIYFSIIRIRKYVRLFL